MGISIKYCMYILKIMSIRGPGQCYFSKCTLEKKTHRFVGLPLGGSTIEQNLQSRMHNS